VEVTRATAIANPSPDAQGEAERLLASCLLVEVSAGLLQAAATLTSRDVRTLDAVHLASAQRVDPDAVLVYDRKLRDAVRAAGFVVAHPGAPD
jgi:predicted nucleic acid-binding protein